MTFDEILEQVVTLLKRQGRVSYPALKIRFSLDDEYLDALKTELLYVHPVSDDEGRGLMWTGETATAQAVAPQASQPTHQPAIQEQLSPQGEFPTVPPAPDAERRHITVIFCDLVESTQLSRRLDLEDLREVVRAYQRVCSEIITRFDGHIAQLLGDGLLVYFGYPHAHEDDAQRAVRTGLGILAAMEDLHTRLQQEKGIQLAVRIGIHTGLVVVGAMGGQGRQEQLALGEVPNVASRLQGLAAPNTLVISEATLRLVQGFFACEALGEQALRGAVQPLQVYRVLQESEARGRLDVAQARGLTPLVGRESEVTLLLERWEQAKDGQGQVILLSGEAGIGKSRLVQVLKDHLANEPHTRWECRSSPYYQNTALYPITDLFQRALQWQPEDTSAEKLGKFERTLSQYRLPVAETVPLFAPLLSLVLPEDRYPPLTLSPQRQRQKTLESLVAILLELAAQQPVLFVLEDLHWTDPTTLELLGLLVEQVPTAALYTLLTCRPEFQPSWSHRSYLTEITVNRLSRNQIEQIAIQVAGGKKLPAQVLTQIIEKTDGVPLFVEEMTKAILESGYLKDVDGHYELTGASSTFAIPATLQDSLMARLDRLVTAKAVAQYAAVIGRQFAYDVLSTVSQLDEATLQRELGRLVEAEIVYQRGVPPQSTYVFKHALIQDAAYESLLKSTRQHYHQRIAQVLAEQFPETAETQPELVAHHYTEAGLTEQAVRYWQQAGEHTRDQSAYVESIAHLRKGLDLLNALPNTPERMQRELDLHILLALAYHAHKGQEAAELEAAYLRARELCQHLGDDRQLFHVLVGLFRCSRDRKKMQETLNELFQLAQRLQEPRLLMEAHRTQGASKLSNGELDAAREHLEHAIALYDPQDHRVYVARSGLDPGVSSLSRASWTLWFLGYPDQSFARSHETLALAQRLHHIHSQALAYTFAAILHSIRGDSTMVQEQVAAAMTLAVTHDMRQWKDTASILQGWCLACYEQNEAGIAQMQQALTTYRETTTLYQVWFLGLLAEAHRQHDQCAAGLERLAEALALLQCDSGDPIWEPELHRLKGKLLLQLSSDTYPEAEACFHQAIAIAQSQHAKSWELRAATSLAKLWQRQGKRQQAYDLLAPIYGWFTEGFETADLMDAKALLDELR
jgi:predicted ATPase/class 3 adenylate cyclase